MTEVFNLATLRSSRVQRQRWAVAIVLALSAVSAGCPSPSEPKVPPRADRLVAGPDACPGHRPADAVGAPGASSRNCRTKRTVA